MSGRWIVPFMVLLAGCAAPAHKQQLDQADTARADSFGVLVMAHGGGKQWNQDVLASLQPLKDEYNLEVAFGMADAASLQQSVQQLESRGARQIGVVRLFISGESFKERTEQILGMIPGAPVKPAATNEHAGHEGHSMEFWRIATQSSFVLSEQGLVEAPEMGEVLARRALALSRDPARENVLILAHGPGDDAENERWLHHLDARAEIVRRAAPFGTVRVETLREDWPEKRELAEKRIRAFVEQSLQQGRRALVVPFRVQGFGPYAEVLKGLDYVSDGQGLVPHPFVTQWIAHQIETLRPQAQRVAQ
jgi:sirohydrochlorin cobaltochelatase